MSCGATCICSGAIAPQCNAVCERSLRTAKKNTASGKAGPGARRETKSKRWRWAVGAGLNEGDFVAIIGRNRPYLYWAMMAAEMCGAVPVPLYQDANAEEMAYVMSHCGARFAVVGDQEQVDKILDVQDELPEFERMIYLDPRGLRKYDHAHWTSIKPCKRWAVRPRQAHQRTGSASGEAELRQHGRDALYLWHNGQAQGRCSEQPQRD